MKKLKGACKFEEPTDFVSKVKKKKRERDYLERHILA